MDAELIIHVGAVDDGPLAGGRIVKVKATPAIQGLDEPAIVEIADAVHEAALAALRMPPADTGPDAATDPVGAPAEEPQRDAGVTEAELADAAEEPKTEPAPPEPEPVTEEQAVEEAAREQYDEPAGDLVEMPPDKPPTDADVFDEKLGHRRGS